MAKNLIYLFIFLAVVAGLYYVRVYRADRPDAGEQVVMNPEEEGTLNGGAATATSTGEDTVTGEVIDMSGQGLDEFPRALLEKKDAIKLVLSNNNLKTLPAEIGELNKLVELFVDQNQLTGALPAEIRKMADLRVLVARDNQMTGVPAEIGQLSKLEFLDLENNQLDTMPNEIENLKDHLLVLNLRGNKYTTEQIGELQKKLPITQVIF